LEIHLGQFLSLRVAEFASRAVTAENRSTKKIGIYRTLMIGKEDTATTEGSDWTDNGIQMCLMDSLTKIPLV